jgi:hypothetical protein
LTIATRITGAMMLVAGPLLAWAVLSSTGGVPKFSPARYFISQLAVPWNPKFDRLNHTFMAAGLMGLPLMILLWRGARWPASRKAGLAGAVAALCLFFVGVFPLSKQVAAHNLFAIGLALSCAVAGSLLAKGIRSHLHAVPVSGMPRFALESARLLAFLQMACIFAGIGIVLWASIQVSPSSLGEWWRELPRYLPYERDNGSIINPLAILEWVYFGICALMLAGVGLWSAVVGRASVDEPAAATDG